MSIRTCKSILQSISDSLQVSRPLRRLPGDEYLRVGRQFTVGSSRPRGSLAADQPACRLIRAEFVRRRACILAEIEGRRALDRQPGNTSNLEKNLNYSKKRENSYLFNPAPVVRLHWFALELPLDLGQGTASHRGLKNGGSMPQIGVTKAGNEDRSVG